MAEKRVVGLSCGDGESAPVVVVKGTGDAAEAVLAAARKRDDLHVVSDAQLVEQLYRVPVDAPIGKELFPVMAVLLSHVLYLDRKQKENRT